MASNQPSGSAIGEFWTWFQTIADELANDFNNTELQRQLDERVALLDADISWELGPGLVAPNALVITPDGRRELLDVTDYIVSRAPTVRDWEFHAAKPPKTWDLSFSIGDDTFDARTWRYVLLEIDGTFDVIVEQPNVRGVDEDTRNLAAEIVVDGLLGERRRLELVDGIEATDALEPEHAPKATAIEYLAEHLAKLSPPRN